ncbi:MAG: WG repeat-containing protein [Chitinophagaceae bacterium]
MIKTILITACFILSGTLKSMSQSLKPFVVNGKWGYRDANDQVIVEPQYDMAFLFEEDMALVILNNKRGFLDKTGKLVIPLKYDGADNFSGGLAQVELNGKWGLLDKSGREITPVKYNYLGKNKEGLYRVSIGRGKDAKWGFVDKNGKEAIAIKYAEARDFDQGVAIVVLKGSYFLIDQSDNRKSAEYGYINDFSEGMAMVLSGIHYGYINKTGKEIILSQYSRAESFKDGKAKVASDEAEFYVDKTGKQILLQPERINYILYKDSYSYGFKDASGKIVIPANYTMARNFTEGLAAVQTPLVAYPGSSSGGTWGFIDKTGKEVIAATYEEAHSFSDGRARVKLNGAYGFISRTGTAIISAIYEDASDFSDGLAMIRFRKKQGYIDNAGKIVIPFKYDEAYGFSNGRARVKINNRYGYIDKTGKEIIPPLYASAGDFSEGFAVVGDLYEKYAYIDSAGKGLSSLYKKALPFINGIAIVQMLENGKYALLDRSGKETPCFFMDDEGIYRRIIINNKTGILDHENNFVVSCSYDTMYSINGNGLVTAKNRADNSYTYLDLSTGKPYNWLNAESSHIIQLSGKNVVLYKHQFRDRQAAWGVKTTDEKVLLYPVFDKLELKADKIIGEINGASISFDAVALGRYKIDFKNTDLHTCPDCEGRGYTTRTTKVNGATKTETSRNATPTWERVWDPTTNSYKEVRGTKETTTTKTTSTKGYTTDEQVKCSRCNGQGAFNYMLWNIVQYTYIFR